MYNALESEEHILNFWQEHKIYEKAKTKGKKPFYFLDGPPYTSGKVHIGQAWNKTLKDAIIRYKRMQGFDVFDRAGYDMHGLPTEHATEKKLGLHGKQDIEKYGVDKFIQECKKLCIDNMNDMNKEFKRLGVWMDFDNAYQSIKEEYIEGIWWLIKKTHEKERLYEGLRTMTWCSHCATALAKHECEYQEVTDKSIFVKLPVKGQENTYLVIWTTTPWTIAFNLAVMVNPELPYQKCTVMKDGKTETWILSKALAGPVIQSVAEATFTVEKEFLGSQLVGMKYEHPFRKELLAYRNIELEHKNAYTVVPSKEYVDTTAGSGLVHCAPGCGPEDYEVGIQNNLPAFNPLDQHGHYPDNMGALSKKKAKQDDEFFIKALEEKEAIIATVPIQHDYAHCWRCHNPVIFRATKQWFFKVEDLKERMIQENNNIKWVPQAAYNAFDSWLNNLRDNSITKQRYWGVPLPVWRCDSCEEIIVIGSKEELSKYTNNNLPEELHKPWIDNITWACACKGEYKRIPDILDVWIDAGSASWNALDFPKTTEQFDKLYPADFILEGKDQIRGWFNLLHVASMLVFDKPAFKACYMHGFINDAQGRKMSKSLGNYILPSEVISKYGANTLRFYVIGAANPGLDMNYNFDDIELKHRNLLVFWNLHSLLAELAPFLKNKPTPPQLEEQYILSRLHTTIKNVTESFDNYKLNETAPLIESLFLDLSRTYVQFAREKMAQGTDQEKALAATTMRDVYITALKLFAPIAPMFAEQIYQNLKQSCALAQESIHLENWPSFDEKKIQPAIEEQFKLLNDIIGATLAARDKAKLGVRWPLAEIRVNIPEQQQKLLTPVESLLMKHVNVKKIVYGKLDNLVITVKPNYKNIGKSFGTATATIVEALKQPIIAQQLHEQGKATIGEHTLTQEHVELLQTPPEGWQHAAALSGDVYLNIILSPELEEEGFARELIRRIQQLRKDAGLQKQDNALITIDAPDLKSTLEKHGNQILTRTGCTIADVDSQYKATGKIRGKQFTIILQKA